MPEYRRREAAGELQFKPPYLDSRTQNLSVPSRDAGRNINCRCFNPISGESIKGVLLFIHGGGWTVFRCDINDLLLAHIADTTGLTVLSVEYRLAPEHPFPCGPEDCYDVDEWLIVNSHRQFDARFCFIAGSVSLPQSFRGLQLNISESITNDVFSLLVPTLRL
jgi:acetyl esterase/lipase